MASILRRAGRAPAVIHRVEREARRRARALVTAAEAEAAALRAEVAVERQEARRQGVQAGREEGKAEVAAALLEALEARRRRLEAAEAEVAACALDAARAVLAAELALAPERVVELARRALGQVQDRREVTLRVHPGDAARLRSAQGRLARQLARGAGLTIREDGEVAPGGVVVETEAGSVDARVEAQLALLEQRLAEEGP